MRELGMPGSVRRLGSVPNPIASMSAVRLGEKNIAITNAASAIPQDTANPSWARIVFPARVSEANVPARISPAAAIVGAACRKASAAPLPGGMPFRTCSRSRAIVRML